MKLGNHFNLANNIAVERNNLHTISTAPMTMFPISLIPTFPVPLSVLFHLIGLNQLRARSQV